MDLATVTTIVQTVLTAFQCSDQFKQFCSLFGNRFDFKSLQSTLETIYAVLEDAEAKHDALSRQGKVFVEQLRDAVYDADDVLDEFCTLVEQKKLINDGDKFSEKVKSFFYKFRPVAFKLFRKVKRVQKKLNDIADNTSKFSFKIDLEANKFRKEESCSFVSEKDNIVGRETDVDKIVNMLLDTSEGKPDVCFLTIVGMGGLGKTALAQLVYNDPRVTSSFPLKEWICVSDQDQHKWNVTEILGKMSCHNHTANTLQKVQEEVRNHLEGKKYLLVLDDVWTVDPNRWGRLAGFLMGGLRGSRIVVTTRSTETANIVGDGETYTLRGLSENESWCLFEKMTCLQGNAPDDELVKMGKEIVKKCADVPLAIRVVGSLLRGQPKKKWVSFQEKGLSVMSGSENTIIPLLKLSYHNLISPLKSCFTYCVLFPKDYEINKDMLIRLWMAQGYIMPQEGLELKDVAEEYFLVLWGRCFFQDVKKYEGHIVSFKMHDLMHDIAEEIAGNEICRVRGHTINVDGNIRHLGYGEKLISEISCKKTRLRTFLQVTRPHSRTRLPLDVLLANCLWLRTLDLHGLDLKCLPESIGKLLHLRYLDLSYNEDLEVLPQSVTKLHNLQTLYLEGCKSLKEWPKNIKKLVKLEVLDTWHCKGLTYMPMGLGHLTGLETLGQFVVGLNSGSGKACVMEELEELKPLINLTGRLDIRIGIPKNAKYKQEYTSGGGYLRDKQHLNAIAIWFEKGEGYGSSEYEEALLDMLQPHPNLRELRVIGYHGERMRRWPPLEEFGNSPAIHLPNLVSLIIGECEELRSLSLIGRLPLLKKLNLLKLPKVEYVVEEEDDSNEGGFLPLFNSLISLRLEDMPRLKGMWRRSSPPHLPLLEELHIEDCPELQMTFTDSIPWFPSLKKLYIINSTRRLSLRDIDGEDPERTSLSESGNFLNLKKLSTTDCESFKSMPTAYFTYLAFLIIEDDDKVESLGGIGNLFQGCSFTNLHTLQIERCRRLRSVKGWIENLPALRNLSIQHCPNLVSKDGEEEEDGVPWQNLPPTLHELHFIDFEDIEKLPKGVQYCTSLRTLGLQYCERLRSVRGLIEHLPTLEKLYIVGCPKLVSHNEEEEKDGIPWQHLPPTLHDLQLIYFKDMEYLPKGVQYCTSLKSLTISDCPKLKQLPTWMPNLTSLTKLKFRNCPEQLKERCKNPYGEDWHLIHHIPQILFKDGSFGLNSRSPSPILPMQQRYGIN